MPWSDTKEVSGRRGRKDDEKEEDDDDDDGCFLRQEEEGREKIKQGDGITYLRPLLLTQRTVRPGAEGVTHDALFDRSRSCKASGMERVVVETS